MSNSGRYLAAQAFVNLKDYSPKGGGADDTAAFTAAVTAAANKLTAAGSGLGMALVYIPADFYRLTNLVVPKGVHLFCDGSLLGPNTSSAGAMITFNDARSGIEGAYLAGGAVVGCSAIAVASGAFHTVIRDCNFDNWDGRAVYDQGTGTTIENIFAQNCLLGANSLAAMTGVVELAGTDAWLFRSELTASRYSARGQSTSGFACALAITNANNMCHSIVAETSDTGVYIGSAATQLQLVGVRAELNYRHGWDIQGGGGEMVACHALRNSQAGANLYNGFNISQPTRFIGRALYSESGGSSPKQNYGLADTGNSQSVYSTWDIQSIGDNVPRFSSNSGMSGFVFYDNPPQGFTGGTPYVDGIRNLVANNTAATNLTAFYHAVNGQRIMVKGDGFTTVVVGANIATLSGSNLLLAANTYYEFVCIANVVTQVR